MNLTMYFAAFISKSCSGVVPLIKKCLARTYTLPLGVSAQTQDTKNEFEMIFRFFCATQTPLPHPSRHTKDTKDLDGEPVWEPDGEPADVPDPRLRMGPSSSSPSGALRTTVVHLLHPN